jgi:hypothetical protein
LFTAAEPRPELAAELNLFAPLIGSWDLIVTDYGDSGDRKVSDGEWHFSWALDGRAVADVWICPRRSAWHGGGDGKSVQEWGTSIRFFDTTENVWRSTWIGPGKRMVRTFVAAATTDGLQLTGSFRPGIETRWTFTGLTSDTFQWRNEDIDSDGTVILRQTFSARRSAGQER